MARNNNTIWIWIVVAIVAILLIGPQLGLFIITGQETLVREFPSPVSAGTNQGINYKVSGASGKWAVSIIDVLKCPGHTDIVKKTVMVSDVGTSLIVFFQLPDEEGITCTLVGNYQFGDKSIKTIPTQTIQTIFCNTEADTNCDGIVDRNELGIYITKWLNNQVTRTKLGEVIMAWVG